MAVSGLVDEHHVEARQIRGGQRRCRNASDDDAIDLPVDECLQMPLGVDLLRLAQQHRVALIARDALGARDDVGVDRIGESGDDDAEGEGALMNEALREAIRPIAKLLRDREDARPRLLGDTGVRVLGEDEGHRWLGDAGLASNVGGGDPGGAKTIWHVANTHWQPHFVKSRPFLLTPSPTSAMTTATTTE